MFFSSFVSSVISPLPEHCLMFFVDFILKEADDSIILLDKRSQHGNDVSCKSDQYDHQYDDDPHG
ncbi:MAG TPA: hypothetical protein VEY51_16265, partial [Chondromyces sp.]|nr:hypothetical protein [Chondromyces sp.]